jgi:hypothetical protein
MYCTLKRCVHLRGQTHSLIAIPLLGQVQLMVIAWPTESRMADQGMFARMKMLSDAVAGGGHSMLSTTAALNLESRSLPSAEHLRGENLHNTTSTFEKSPLHGQYQTCLSELWGEATSLESLRHQYVHSQRHGQIRPPEQIPSLVRSRIVRHGTTAGSCFNCRPHV